VKWQRYATLPKRSVTEFAEIPLTDWYRLDTNSHRRVSLHPRVDLVVRPINSLRQNNVREPVHRERASSVSCPLFSKTSRYWSSVSFLRCRSGYEVRRYVICFEPDSLA